MNRQHLSGSPNRTIVGQFSSVRFLSLGLQPLLSLLRLTRAVSSRGLESVISSCILSIDSILHTKAELPFQPFRDEDQAEDWHPTVLLTNLLSEHIWDERVQNYFERTFAPARM